MESIEFVQNQLAETGIVQGQCTNMVHAEKTQAAEKIVVRKRMSSIENIHTAVLFQNIADQTDKDILFGRIIPVKRCPRDAGLPDRCAERLEQGR